MHRFLVVVVVFALSACDFGPGPTGSTGGGSAGGFSSFVGGGSSGFGGGSSATGGGPAGGGSSGAGGGAVAMGSFPAELSGVWQNTRATGGTFTNQSTGVTFSMTEGFSAQFKVQPNGEFYFAHYSSGVSATCPLVSFMDQMTGLAEFVNNRLVLRPRERRLDVRNCANSGSFPQTLEPVTFDAALSEYPTSLDTTLQMELTNGPYPLAFKLLSRPPPSNLQPPAQPPQFQLGPYPGYMEFLGTWGRYQTDFYNPQTGATLFRDCCGEGRFLTIQADGYQLGFTFTRANLEGVCKRDLIYFERGTANFLITDNRGSDTVQGDVRFTPTEARLYVRIRECGREDGTTEYTLTPLPGYYRWSYTSASSVSADSFMIGCQYPRGHWSFPLCYDANPWVTLERK
jgi:hypothetical protein